MMSKEEVEDIPNVVNGNFSINTYPVKVLLDSDVTHSFISAGLVETLRLVWTTRYSLLSITLPNAYIVSFKSMVMTFWLTYISLD